MKQKNLKKLSQRAGGQQKTIISPQSSRTLRKSVSDSRRDVQVLDLKHNFRSKKFARERLRMTIMTIAPPTPCVRRKGYVKTKRKGGNCRRGTNVRKDASCGKLCSAAPQPLLRNPRPTTCDAVMQISPTSITSQFSVRSVPRRCVGGRTAVRPEDSAR